MYLGRNKPAGYSLQREDEEEDGGKRLSYPEIPSRSQVQRNFIKKTSPYQYEYEYEHEEQQEKEKAQDSDKEDEKRIYSSVLPIFKDIRIPDSQIHHNPQTIKLIRANSIKRQQQQQEEQEQEQEQEQKKENDYNQKQNRFYIQTQGLQNRLISSDSSDLEEEDSEEDQFEEQKSKEQEQEERIVERYTNQQLMGNQIGVFVLQRTKPQKISSFQHTMSEYYPSNYFQIGPRSEMLEYLESLAKFVAQAQQKKYPQPSHSTYFQEQTIALGSEILKFMTKKTMERIHQVYRQYYGSNYFHVGPRRQMFAFLRSIIVLVQKCLKDQEEALEARIEASRRVRQLQGFESEQEEEEQEQDEQQESEEQEQQEQEQEQEQQQAQRVQQNKNAKQASESDDEEQKQDVVKSLVKDFTKKLKISEHEEQKRQRSREEDDSEDDSEEERSQEKTLLEMTIYLDEKEKVQKKNGKKEDREENDPYKDSFQIQDSSSDEEEQEQEEEEEQEEVRQPRSNERPLHNIRQADSDEETTVTMSKPEYELTDSQIKSIFIGYKISQLVVGQKKQSLRSTMGSYSGSNYFHVGPRYQILSFASEIIRYINAPILSPIDLIKSIPEPMDYLPLGEQIQKIMTPMQINSLKGTISQYYSSNYFHVGPRRSLFHTVRCILQCCEQNLV